MRPVYLMEFLALFNQRKIRLAIIDVTDRNNTVVLSPFDLYVAAPDDARHYMVKNVYIFDTPDGPGMQLYVTKSMTTVDLTMAELLLKTISEEKGGDIDGGASPPDEEHV